MAKKKIKPNEVKPESAEPEIVSGPAIVDPIGDTTDGEARAATELGTEPGAASEIVTAEVEAHPDAEIEDGSDAVSDTEADSSDEEDDESEPEFNPKPRPPAKLERLQKILAQAGVASRRKAEEMIEQGRIQVNGKTVTELGTKADAGRDHIRVDGKLLHGAERLRYFVLNKPKGFVTTVKDPEGRPTVMQFFDKMRERLYPVGRLDYMSEGLLLVTNDGDLANRLTRAASGIEKTYLVKVAGQPTEGELDALRGGVMIERGKPGSAQVRTSPARIRQVRQGDNPWYEVVLIEGRNRELRKMFEEVGHFVEKIRRVGYGPLVLDQEPGNLRELDADELELLRKAADGKLRTPKAKEVRRRNIADSLPPEKPAFRPRPARPVDGSKDYRPKRSFSQGIDKNRRPSRPASGGFTSVSRPAWKKGAPPARPPARSAEGSGTESRPFLKKPLVERPAGERTFGSKPPGTRTFGGKPFGDRPAARGSFGAKPTFNKPAGGKPAFNKPAWSKPERSERPSFRRSAPPRRDAPAPIEDLGPRKPSRIHIEPIPDSDRTRESSAPRQSFQRPPSGRPFTGRSGPVRSSGGSSDARRSGPPRPFREEGGLARPFTTSSGKPRAGGPRPSSKPGRQGGRPYSEGSGRGVAPRAGGSRPGLGYRATPAAKRPFERPSTGYKRPETGAGPRPPRTFTPRDEGASESRARAPKPFVNSGPRADRKSGSGWKPKSNFGGPHKPSSSGRSKPRPGSSAKSGFKPGGKRPGGKKRG
jgi:23S rRNA pseudouridine2605 synthase